MSEKLRQSHEHIASHESDRNQEILAQKIERAKEAKNEHAEALEHIRRNIDKQAVTAEKTHAEQEPQHQQEHVTRELKAIRYNETLRYIKRHLTKSERRLSTVIHAPVIEKASEIGAKTIARPSGILGGGLFALVGSIFVLYIARRYGFEVPNSLFMVLFVLGFGAGILSELIASGLFKKHGRRYKKAGRH